VGDVQLRSSHLSKFLFASHGDLVAAVLFVFFNAQLTFLPRQDRQPIGKARLLKTPAPGFTDRVDSFLVPQSINRRSVDHRPRREKITSLILEGSGGFLWPVLAAERPLACLILGMEVPTTAALCDLCLSAGLRLLSWAFHRFRRSLCLLFALCRRSRPQSAGGVIAQGMIGEELVERSR